MDIIEIMKSRFRRGNSVPVERAHITREEWEVVSTRIAELEEQIKAVQEQQPDSGDRPEDVDALLRRIGLDPDRCRTECGFLNVTKTLSLLRDSEEELRSQQDQPSDEALAKFAAEEQFLLFCDEDEFVQIAREVLNKFARRIERCAKDDSIRELLTERDQLAAALEAAREDAERYRWLRNHYGLGSLHNADHHLIVARNVSYSGAARGLDATIDAAISAEKENA